jgi:hypothetical protein
LIGLFKKPHNQLQKQASRSVDIALVVRNWLFGWYIVEYEQDASDRAKYGSLFFEVLSKNLADINIKEARRLVSNCIGHFIRSINKFVRQCRSNLKMTQKITK